MVLIAMGDVVNAQSGILPHDGEWELSGTYSDTSECGDFAGLTADFTSIFEFSVADEALTIFDIPTEDVQVYEQIDDNLFASETTRMVATVTVLAENSFTIGLDFKEDLDGCTSLITATYLGDEEETADANDTRADEDMVEISEGMRCSMNINSIGLCFQQGDLLFETLNKTSDLSTITNLTPDEGAFVILNAGGAPLNVNGYATAIFNGPAQYTLDFNSDNLAIFEDNMVTFYNSVDYFGVEQDLIPGGDMFFPGYAYYGEDIEFPPVTYIPGGDMFFPEDSQSTHFYVLGEMFIPGGEMFISQADGLAIPGGDMFFRDDAFEVGTNYYGTLLIPTQTEDGEPSYMMVIAGSENAETPQSVMQDILAIDTSRVRLYQVDPITGEQLLLDTAEYLENQIILTTTENSLISLYVFPTAEKAENAPKFMRYPPPQ